MRGFYHESPDQDNDRRWERDGVRILEDSWGGRWNNVLRDGNLVDSQDP